jgi:hypothetical protein
VACADHQQAVAALLFLGQAEEGISCQEKQQVADQAQQDQAQQDQALIPPLRTDY